MRVAMARHTSTRMLGACRRAQTWRITAVPIRFSGQTVITAALTLVPGVTILFRADGSWAVLPVASPPSGRRLLEFDS